MVNNPTNLQVGTNSVFGGDGPGVLAISEVNAPVEGVSGAVNGMVNGAVLSLIASAALTYAGAKGEGPFLREAISNVKSTHLGSIIGATAAISALSGFVHYSRAAKHNEGIQEHYKFLREQAALEAGAQAQEAPKSFTEREDAKKAAPANKEVGA